MLHLCGTLLEVKIGHDTPDAVLQVLSRGGTFTSLYLPAMLLLVHTVCGWISLPQGHTTDSCTSCCLTEPFISSSPKLLSIHLAPSLYCCLSYSIPGGGLCIYLYEACVSPFLQSVVVPLQSSPALPCIVSSSHFDKSVYLLRVQFVSSLIKTLNGIYLIYLRW